MKIRKNIIVITSLVLIIGLITRIWYVNNVEYKKCKPQTYSIGDEFKINKIDVSVIDVNVLTKEQLVEKYSENVKEMADDSNIIVSIRLDNVTEKEQDIDLTGIALFLENKISGGNMNPYLVSYLNENGVSISLQQGESKIIYAPYPYGDYLNAELIFNLYPKRISVKLF